MTSTKLFLCLLLSGLALICRAHTSESDVLNIHALPLGDGKVSTYPKPGYVDSCQSNFRRAGARHVGNWIHDGTWDATKKISVRGHVTWANARFRILNSDTSREIIGNDLPVKASTGIFPIQASDPAYRIDHNPNVIKRQTIRLNLPLYPQLASTPSCVPMGMIGVMLNGVALFNALDDAGRDAVAHEVQDRCHGHPQHRGEYHYHGPSPCIPGIYGKATLIGYALDGFGIYSMYDENGRELTNQDLDACHGRTSPVIWDGKLVNMYHYVMTREYPYSIGCFKGTPAYVTPNIVPTHFSPRHRRGRHGPPAMAIQACAGRWPGEACHFKTPRGVMLHGTCGSPTDKLACVPGNLE